MDIKVKRFEKLFYIIEIVIVAIFIAVCCFVSKNEPSVDDIIILILSLILTILASSLNITTYVLQWKNK